MPSVLAIGIDVDDVSEALTRNFVRRTKSEATWSIEYIGNIVT